jgi:hypothetical protein
MTQEDFMKTDDCILVDSSDRVTGAAAKIDAHRFVPDRPTGQLHRAFSVFLFDSQDRLLLQQRSLSKVTFPGVRADPRFLPLCLPDHSSACDTLQQGPVQRVSCVFEVLFRTCPLFQVSLGIEHTAEEHSRRMRGACRCGQTLAAATSYMARTPLRWTTHLP